MFKNKDDFIRYFHTYHPLQQEVESIDDLLKNWEENEQKLEVLFARRDSERTFEPMCLGIITFLFALYMANGKTIESIDIHTWSNTISDFHVCPVNLNDRLMFIIEHPTQFHSFVQLKQLYRELLKKHAVQKRKQQKRHST